MTQMDLFDGLQPVKKWLHVWTDAERERNKEAMNKKIGHAAETSSGQISAQSSGCKSLRVT